MSLSMISMRDRKLSKFCIGAIEHLLLLALLFSVVMEVHAWGWGSESQAKRESSQHHVLRNEPANFPLDMDNSIAIVDTTKGKHCSEKSNSLLMASDSCWQMAYLGMRTSCQDILKDDNQKSRLAYRLTDCFLQTSGRPRLRSCTESTRISSCTKELDEHTHEIFLAFFLDCAAMCHYIQSDAFKKDTDRVIKSLKESAHNTQNTLSSINLQLDVQHGYVMEHTDYILEAQKHMQAQQAVFQSALEGGVLKLQDAISEAAREIKVISDMQKQQSQQQEELANEITLELQEAHHKGDKAKEGMSGLYDKVEDLVGQSLAEQEETIKGFTDLQILQIDAVAQSRASMSSLASEAREHHINAYAWQKELESMQQRLQEGSNHMMKSQDSMSSKQSLMFNTLENLFAIHNAIMLESRLFKTVFAYFACGMALFIATTTRQTIRARPLIFFGLFVTFTFEAYLVRFKKNDGDENTFSHWGLQNGPTVRNIYMIFAVIFLIWTCLSFRDYDLLNHSMLLSNWGVLDEVKQNQDKFTEDIVRNVREEIRARIRNRTDDKTQSHGKCDRCQDPGPEDYESTRILFELPKNKQGKKKSNLKARPTQSSPG